MKKEDATQRILRIMQSSEAVYLTSIDTRGFPQTRAMLNLRNPQQFPTLQGLFEKHPNDFSIYFTTNTSSSKVRQITNNSKTSVYYCTPGEWRGVMFEGDAEIVSDAALKQAFWVEGWERYYSLGVSDPDYTILRVELLKAKLYDQLSFFTLELAGEIC